MFTEHASKALVPLLLTLGLSATVSAQEASSPVQNSADAQEYRDGVYTATGEYGGQPSFVTVTVTLADDTISAVQVETHATVPRSLELQQQFAAAVPGVVVGKRLDEVRVGKLAGSSSTPDGFNNAIDQIKQQAAL